MLRVAALLVVVGCASAAPPPAASNKVAVASAPPSPPSWIDTCDRELRAAGARLVALGMPGPLLSQRERWTEWGAQEYDTYVTAAATNWRLFPDPPAVDPEAAPTDGLVFAIGRSMKYRVMLIPIDCLPRAAQRKPWYDVQKYWDPDELAQQRDGVSVTIHTDPTLLLGKTFIDAMQPVVERCLDARPPMPPTRTCSPVPG
jgi:hypothetical protein